MKKVACRIAGILMGGDEWLLSKENMESCLIYIGGPSSLSGDAFDGSEEALALDNQKYKGYRLQYVGRVSPWFFLTSFPSG